MQRLVTTTHLEMLRRSDMRPARRAMQKLEVIRVEIPCPALNRFLYTAVGAAWWWYSRLPWSYAQWLAYVDRSELETWVGYVSGTPVGYFELEAQKDGNIEIAYFGLLPEFIGNGLGGQLLTAAITRAWDRGARRVWVHTCDLDHPRARGNYEARGFQVFKVEAKHEELPDVPLEVWPGAMPR